MNLIKKIGATAAGLLLLAGCGAPALSDNVTSTTTASVARADQVYSDPQDPEENFIADLDSEGVYYSSERNAIVAGYAVCTGIEDGLDFMDLVSGFVQAGYTGYDSGYIVGAAANAFCPEYVPYLDAMVDGS